MITQEFRLPDLGEGIHEAEILEVCVAAGQAVREGETILQVETDKAVVEVPSPCTGTVAEINVKQGDLVRVGEVLMTFTTGEVEKKAPQQPAQAVQPAGQPRRGVTVALEDASQPRTCGRLRVRRCQRCQQSLGEI
jgi:pyruvate dehydrogenase E2 component (dihydrolipoyllysine-residue acetyltransferase)